MATGNHLRHYKKKVTRDQRLLYAIQKQTGDICYWGSMVVPYFFQPRNDLYMLCVFFFPENHDELDKVSAEIADSLKFGILR